MNINNILNKNKLQLKYTIDITKLFKQTKRIKNTSIYLK